MSRVPILVGFFALVVATLGAIGFVMAFGSETISAATFVVLAVTLVAIVWYTLETHWYRQAAESTIVEMRQQADATLNAYLSLEEFNARHVLGRPLC